MGSKFTLEMGACKKKDLCCVHSGVKYNTLQRFLPTNHSDTRISWGLCRNKRNCKACTNLGNCEECLGIGQSKIAAECDKLYKSFRSSKNSLKYNDCLLGTYHLQQNSMGKGQEFVNGPCNVEDGCCMDIRETKPPANYWRCGEDVCLQHLNWIQTDSKIIKNLSSWYTNKDIIFGRSVGGKVCTQLRFYSMCMIVPLLLSFTFQMVTCIRDYKKGDTHFPSLILAVFQFYPQWRAIRSLFSSKDRDKQDMDARNFTLELIEPLLESVLQVNYSSEH